MHVLGEPRQHAQLRDRPNPRRVLKNAKHIIKVSVTIVVIAVVVAATVIADTSAGTRTRNVRLLVLAQVPKLVEVIEERVCKSSL